MALTDKEILAQIKAAVLEVIPDAKVYLFGSRARGDWHEESDWDILVLTGKEVNRELRSRIHKAVYPISLEINDFINHVTVNENEWKEGPAYYALQKSVEPDMISL